MDFETVDLGRDYPGRIDDFAKARNYFLERYDWVLFLAEDEEASKMLLDYIRRLNPHYPYYWIRRLNLMRGRYVPAWNPEYSPQLVSSKVKFYGRVHEHVKPRKPHGTIDFPIIHNQPNTDASYRNYWYQNTAWYQWYLGAKKVVEVVRGR